MTLEARETKTMCRADQLVGEPEITKGGLSYYTERYFDREESCIKKIHQFVSYFRRVRGSQRPRVH